MKIIVTSIFVEDQQKALKFYTETLGFLKKHDLPAGEFRWISLVSPDNPEGTELILEPNNNQAAKDFQMRLFEQGIPVTMFGVDDIEKEYERLSNLGVKFTMPPTKMGMSQSLYLMIHVVTLFKLFSSKQNGRFIKKKEHNIIDMLPLR